jgi:WG containing repeat
MSKLVSQRQTQKLLGDLAKYIYLALVVFCFNPQTPTKAPRKFIIRQPIAGAKNMDHYKYSYIDKAGGIAIDAGKYDVARSFSDGLAAVFLEDKGWGVIDKTSKEIIKPLFEEASGFSEGLAAVQIRGKWGGIDKTGQVMIKPQYDVINSFSEGMAVAVKGNDVMLINRVGQTIFSRSMDDLQLNIHEGARFSEGLIDAYDPAKSKYGFIDKTGQFVIEPKFNKAGIFSEGLARVAIVEDGEEKLGFIDHNGQFVIQPIYNTDFDFRRNSTDFSEGLASLSEGLQPTITEEAKFVYIDKKGAITLFTNFFYAGPFHEGMAVVYDAERKKLGYIDKSGKLVIPLHYDLASSFSEGVACVTIRETK